MALRWNGSGRWRQLALPIAVAVVASGCWSQYRGDWGHSGHQPFESVIGRTSVSTLAHRWVAVTGSPVDAAPTLGDSVAFVVARNGKLFAFDAAGVKGCSGGPKKCAPLWTATVPDVLQSSPALARGVVYVQGFNAVYAFDAAGLTGCSGTPKTCAPLWKTSVIGYAKSSVNVAYGKVYASGAQGLKAFDAAGIANCGGSPKICAPLWVGAPFTPNGDASPAVAAGKVYVSNGSSMYVYDAAGSAGCSGTPTTCSPLWRTGGAASSPAVVDGVVYLAGGTSGLNAFDAAGIVNCAGSPKSCSPLWRTTLSATTSAGREPPAIANGVVYLPLDGALHAFDAAGIRGCGGTPRRCAPRWSTAPAPTASGVITGAPIVANHVVYSGGSKRLAAYDATGATNCASLPKACDPLWATTPSAAGFTSPVVLSGTVYAGAADGLHAFRRSSRLPAPRISSLAPRAVRGATTTVVVSGTGFVPGLGVATTIPGASVGVPTAVTASGFTVAIAVPGAAEPGTYKLSVTNPDQGLATKSITFNTTSPEDVASRAGISADPLLLEETPAEQIADLDAIAALGGRWMTIDVLWINIQNTGRDTFVWDLLDAAVINARARGLELIGSVSYSPAWAAAADCPASELLYGHCLPANPGDYARFVGAAATRYGSLSNVVLNGTPLRNSITRWQIWNEPNNQVFAFPKPNLDDYTAMLKASYLTIKAADPSAFVLTAGTSPAGDLPDGGTISPETWLRGLYARGARDSFDAVAHHPYSFPTNPLEPHPWNAYTQTQILYDVMVEFGDAHKKVWGTEVGVPTGTSQWSMTEVEQAFWAYYYYLGWNTNFAAFTGPLTWKAIRDTTPDTGAVWENTGLLRHDRTEKPSYPAFRSIMAQGLP